MWQNHFLRVFLILPLAEVSLTKYKIQINNVYVILIIGTITHVLSKIITAIRGLHILITETLTLNKLHKLVLVTKLYSNILIV